RVALQLAREGVASSPDRLGNWLILGRTLFALGEFEEAATCLRDAVAILPLSAELRLLLATTLMAQDLFEEALPHAEAALVIAPRDVGTRRLVFELVASLKHGDGGRLDMGSLAEVLPTRSDLMEMQGTSLGPVSTLELCDAQLEENAAHTNAKYLKAIA